jgi:hypothetical protein
MRNRVESSHFNNGIVSTSKLLGSSSNTALIQTMSVIITPMNVLPYCRIAVVLGVSRSTFLKNLSRGKNALADFIELGECEVV